MPNALAVGVPYETFWHLNPNKLAAFQKAHDIKIKEMDYLMYLWFGQYGLSSVFVAIEHNLAGKKANSKYVDKTVYELLNKNKESSSLPEEELKKQRELFMMQLIAMKSNYDLNEKKKEKNAT